MPPRTAWALEQAGVHPLLARLFAARGVRGADELDDGLARLLPPSGLLGSDDAAVLLADAIGAGSRICVVADYDCDGATACAVALRGLRLLGADPATLAYVVPDRRIHGYGLTPQIVDLALAAGADVLVTVDNGIASLEGVAHAQAARARGRDHRPPPAGRAATASSLPRRRRDRQPEPARLHASRASTSPASASPSTCCSRCAPSCASAASSSCAAQPRLDALLDLVALGTVADVVRLDRNNRCLVAQGLKRIRAGRMQPGVAALFAVAGRDPRQASAADFGFAIGPRLNAAGRLADMTLGIECLLDRRRRARRRAGGDARRDQPRAAHARGGDARAAPRRWSTARSR